MLLFPRNGMPTITLTLRDLEIAALLVLLALSVWMAGRVRWRRALPRVWLRMAGSTRRAVALAGIAGFVVSAGVSLVAPVEPRFHDEFSYLLGADTFAEGRLTNPGHPQWRHFETYHVIQQPTYQSKYPPGQGLMLALGQVLTGQPLVGVWLSFAFACAALCWMLCAFVPTPWALVGALLPLLRFGIFDYSALFAYWHRSYWGGALAMLGGALVYGALRRILHKARLVDGLYFGIGGGVLLLTRPFEGAVASLPAIATLAVWLFRQRGIDRRTAMTTALLPAAVALSLFVGFLGVYHHAVTGSAWISPYQVYEQRYSEGLAGFFRADAPPSTSVEGDDGTELNELMRSRYEVLEQTRSEHMDTLPELSAHAVERIATLGSFFLGPLLLLPLVLNVFATLRRPWLRLACLSLALVGLEIFVLDYVFPHYFAPVACLIVLLVVQSLRAWQGWKVAGRRVGAVAVRGTLLLAVLGFVGALSVFGVNAQSAGKPWNLRRAQIVERLESQPGKHLVLVVTGKEPPNLEAEWVYNRARIDEAKIVWARSLGREGNQSLRAYFPEHRVWMAFVDERPVPIRPLAR